MLAVVLDTSQVSNINLYWLSMGRIHLDEEGMQSLITLGAGDMRRTLNIFQARTSTAACHPLCPGTCNRNAEQGPSMTCGSHMLAYKSL